MDGNVTTTEQRIVLFADIHHFSLAWQGQEHRQVGFLQAVYELLGDIIVAHDGKILKYLGDGLLCLFPAGTEEATVSCAQSMRKAYGGLTESWQVAAETELEIGISSGTLTSGIFGHDSHRIEDAFGEAINLAVTIGHHLGIAVTKEVLNGLGGQHATRRLPDVTVKWRESPIAVWEVVEKPAG